MNTNKKMIKITEINQSVAILLIVLMIFLSFGIFFYHFNDSGIFWDVAWYKLIAVNGYDFDGNYKLQQNVAFMPGSPFFDFIISSIFNIEYDYAIYLSNLILICISSFVFFKLVNIDFDRNIAVLSVAFLLFNPFSIYFYNGYSESKFLCLFIIYLFFLRTEKWLLASFFGGLSFIVRPYGMLLLIPFIIAYIVYYLKENKAISVGDSFLNGLIYIIIFLLPFSIFLYANYVNYGDPFLQYNIASKAWSTYIDSNYSSYIFNKNLYVLALDIDNLEIINSRNVAALFYISCILSLVYLIYLKKFYFFMSLPFIIILCFFQVNILNLGRYVGTLSLFTYIIVSVVCLKIFYYSTNRYMKFFIIILLVFIFYILININLQFSQDFFSHRWVS